MSGLAGWLRRLPPLVWVAAVAVVAIGLTATLGGFAPAPDHGRPVEAGERVLIQRWQIQVVFEVPADAVPGIRVRVRLSGGQDQHLLELRPR